ADVVELALELVEQPGLAEPGFAIDLDECEVARERVTNSVGELLHLGRAPQEPERPTGAVRAGRADRAREQGVDVLLAGPSGLERAGLGGGLEAGLLVEPGTEAAVESESLVLSPERVEREHLQAVRALAEAVYCRRGLGPGECGAEVALGEGGVGGLEAGA